MIEDKRNQIELINEEFRSVKESQKGVMEHINKVLLIKTGEI